MDYVTASEDFIRETINKELYDEIFIPCYNLSCMLGDVNGRITSNVLTPLLTGLDIVSPGVLVLGETGEAPVEPILVDAPYNLQTSRSAYSMYLLLRNSDESIVTYLDASADLIPDSPVISYSLDISPVLRNAINTLYIECLALYRELLVVTREQPISFTLEDVRRIVSNTRWLSLRLESLDIRSYDLIECVRDLQQTVSYITSIPSIFSTSQSAKMTELVDLSPSVEGLNDTYYTREYMVQHGDNIHMVAQRLLGDASKAIDIITINDMEYPFIVGELGPVTKGVAQPGDLILVPVFNQVVRPDTSYDYLGSDLKVIDRTLAGGDLDVNVYGDLQLVEGIDCLAQDLRSRLLLEVGTVPLHPEYGNRLSLLIGQRNDPDWEQKARIEANKIFLSDDRITDVRSLIVTKIPGGISIDAMLEVAGRDSLMPFSEYIKEG